MVVASRVVRLLNYFHRRRKFGEIGVAKSQNWGSNRRIDTALEAKHWVGHGPLSPPPVPTPMTSNANLILKLWDT